MNDICDCVARRGVLLYFQVIRLDLDLKKYYNSQRLTCKQGPEPCIETFRTLELQTGRKHMETIQDISEFGPFADLKSFLCKVLELVMKFCFHHAWGGGGGGGYEI